MVGRSKRSVLVTGAGGFVGQHVCAALEAQGHIVRRVHRGTDRKTDWIVSDLATEDIPDAAFKGIHLLIHLAASVPGRQDDPAGTKTAEIAMRIARNARRNKTPRVIHLSSVAARLAEENDPSARAYGAQKLQAESSVSEQLGSGCQLVTLRPPVIYGPGAKGSFAALIGLIRRQLPLPIGGADQGRCYLSVGNLCALVTTLVNAGESQWKAADRIVFEPHDGPATPTNDLALMLANSLGVNARLFWVPQTALRLLARLAGKIDQIDPLYTALNCRNTPSLHEAFNWQPHEEMPESLAYLESQFGLVAV